MAKWNDEDMKKYIEQAQAGKPLKRIGSEGGPKPAALKRHAKKLGMVLPKRGGEKKTPSAPKKAAAVKAAPKKPVAKKAPVKKPVVKKA